RSKLSWESCDPPAPLSIAPEIAAFELDGFRVRTSPWLLGSFVLGTGTPYPSIHIASVVPAAPGSRWNGVVIESSRPPCPSSPPPPSAPPAPSTHTAHPLFRRPPAGTCGAGGLRPRGEPGRIRRDTDVPRILPRRRTNRDPRSAVHIRGKADR